MIKVGCLQVAFACALPKLCWFIPNTLTRIFSIVVLSHINMIMFLVGMAHMLNVVNTKAYWARLVKQGIHKLYIIQRGYIHSLLSSTSL
jgi:hypothetical protein